jgi:hypothetical protein
MKLKRLGRLSEGLQFEGAFGVGFKTLYALGCTAFFYAKITFILRGSFFHSKSKGVNIKQ